LKPEIYQTVRCKDRVETLRKPSTGLKLVIAVEQEGMSCYVETLRKPSTGLKLVIAVEQEGMSCYVETLRKPSTGLKQVKKDDDDLLV